MTSRTRALTTTVLALRVAYGAALIVAPERLSRRWLGPDGGRAATQVALRGLGAREVTLHVLALVAALRGAPVRGFLAASVAGDLADVAATVAGREQLPDGAAVATAVVAGGSALLSAGVAVLADR